MRFRLLIILSIVGLAEYYSFIVVRSSVRNMPSVWRITLTSVYVLLTALSWLGLIFFRQINREGVPHLIRNIYMAFVIGFIVGKILVLLVMLIDDIRRLFTWLVGLIVYRNDTKMDVPSGITRSLFLKRTALVLGGLSLVGFTYGIRNRYNYRVRKIKLKSVSIPDAFKGLKIVQISDIHTGSFDDHSAVARGIQRVMDQ